MSDWEILTTRPLIDRRPWLRVWEEDVRLPDGQVIDGYLRTWSRDYAMAFAILTDGTVPLVRQYKHGIERPSYDLPAGYLETPDEPTLEAAQRELQEETGITAPHWELLGRLVIDSNRGCTRAHIYLARDGRVTHGQHLDPSESLLVSRHTPDELLAMVRRGEIDSMPSVAAIMLALPLIGA